MRHSTTERHLGAATAILILLIAAACQPALPAIDPETLPRETAVSLTETESQHIESRTPTASPTPSPKPTVTPAAPPPDEQAKDDTNAGPTEAAHETVDAVREADKVLAAATADLAERLGITEDGILARSVGRVLWPDTSLGCPEPDIMYAQVQTPGYIILLEVEGETYRYHTDDGGRVILCPSDAAAPFPMIPMNPKEVDDGTPWMPVD
jgi:hypothetical protein